MIERDYALGYVLAGMAKEPALADSLAFKGGTALRKLFFGDYRFSEDLDFSAMAVPSDGWSPIRGDRDLGRPSGLVRARPARLRDRSR